MKVHYALAVLAGLAVSSGVHAQNIKPGLWEITHSMKSSSGQMESAQAQMKAQMANMSPEQKKQMQDMMAKHGMQMGAGGPGGMSVKTCMTREMIERNEVPTGKSDCKTTKQEKRGNTMKFTVTCPNPPSTSEGEITYTSAEAYTMKMVVTTQREGKSETMNMDGSGKWLSADCGNIKPMGTPPGKK